jgi:sec-independent protein translocase protein TatC
MTKKPDEFSVWDHAEDLRRKLLLVLLVFGGLFLFSYFFFSARVVEYLVGRVDRDLYYLSVFEPFLTRLRVSAAVSLVVTIPVLLVQIARFVLPGLYPAERAAFIGFAALLMALMAVVAVVMFRFSSLILGFFLEAFAAPSVDYRLSVATLISFYIMLMLGDALIILTPLVVFVLMKLDLITPEGVRRSRRYVIPLFMLLAAAVTPPDPFTMIAVALPLWGVYEVSFLGMRLVDRLSIRARNRTAGEAPVR